MDSPGDSASAPRVGGTGSQGLLGWLVPCVVLLVAIGLSFAHAFARGPAGMSGLYDAYQYFGPLAFYLDSALHAGELPLWNPLTYCGLPFAGNPQASLFYPPHLLRGLLNVAPTPFSTQASMIAAMGLHMLLAGVGVFRLARSFGLAWGSAMASALAFTLSAAMVRRVSEYHFVYTLAWLPWMLLATKRCLEASAWRAKLRAALGIGVLAAVAYLGGFLHIIVYMGVAIGVYALNYRVLVVPRLHAAAPRSPGLDVAALVLAGILAAGLGAVALLPGAELASFSARQQGESVKLYVDLHDLAPAQLLESLVVYPGRSAAGSGIRGSGLLALVLALAAGLHRQRRAVVCLALTYMALVDCSLGPPMPLARLVAAITPFANSAPARAYDVALLPLSLLVGFGVDALGRREAGTPAVGRWLLVAVGLALLIPLWNWTSPHRFVRTTRLVVLAPFLGLLLAGVAPRLPRRVPLTLGLAALILVETLAWNHGYADALLRKRHAEPPGKYVGQASMPLDNVRGVDVVPNRELFALRPVMNGYDPLNIRRAQAVLDGWNRGASEYHRTVKAVEPTAFNQRGNLFLKRSFWLARYWSPGALPDRDQLYESTTTVFLAQAPDMLEVPRRSREEVVGHALSGAGEPLQIEASETFFDPVPADTFLQRFGVVQMPGAAGGLPGPPRAAHMVLLADYTSSLVQVDVRPRFEDLETGRISYGTFSAISAGTGALEVACPDMRRARVSFEVAAGAAGAGAGSFAFTALRGEVDPGDEDVLLTIVERRANSVELEVGPLEGWRMLTHVDAHYPGWRAEVDGEEVPIYLANDAFKAVAVPPGTHRVRFLFEPLSVRRGGLISALSLALATAAGLALRRRRGHAG